MKRPTDKFDYPFANPRHRLAGKVLDLVFMTITLFIGWFVWSMVMWAGGRTPGQQLVGMRVYSIDTRKPVTWGHMALREFILPFTVLCLFGAYVGILYGFTSSASPEINRLFYFVGITFFYAVYVIDAFWVFVGNTRQRLVDVIARTVVLNEVNE